MAALEHRQEIAARTRFLIPYNFSIQDQHELVIVPSYLSRMGRLLRQSWSAATVASPSLCSLPLRSDCSRRHEISWC